MQIALIVTILSFFLESIVSNFVSINSDLFLPLFTIVALVIIYPFFKKDRSTYFKIAAILGLFYDVVFTDTLIVNFFLFLMTAYFIEKVNYMLSNNYLNVAIITALSIAFYRSISFLVLVIIGYLPFSWYSLARGITTSLLLNIIYAVLLYGITDFIARKYHITKID